MLILITTLVGQVFCYSSPFSGLLHSLWSSATLLQNVKSQLGLWCKSGLVYMHAAVESKLPEIVPFLMAFKQACYNSAHSYTHAH